MARAVPDKNPGLWVPELSPSQGPIYQGIVRALAHDIAAGRLAAGDMMPSQRDLAVRLGINFTTVTRAYAEARSQGLIVTRAGQGTFVRPGPNVSPGIHPEIVDLASNWAPPSVGAKLLTEVLSGIVKEKGGTAIQSRGSPIENAHFHAAERWLSQYFAEDVGDRLALSAGARGALLAVMSQTVGAGGILATEELTWPAIKAIARLLDIRLVGLEVDREGIVPSAFEQSFQAHKFRALYCTPTLQNPTTGVMSAERRSLIADIARRNGVVIIEDDAYSQLLHNPPLPIAARDPDVTYYIGGLSKILSSGLRVGYIVCPDVANARQLTDRLRFTMLLPPTLDLEVATQLIQLGHSTTIVRGVREEMANRHHILQSVLSNTEVITTNGSLHAFLPLPSKWPRAEFITELSRSGVRVATSDAFAISSRHAPNALRLSIGAPASADDLKRALTTVANLYEDEATFMNSVI